MATNHNAIAPIKQGGRPDTPGKLIARRLLWLFLGLAVILTLAYASLDHFGRYGQKLPHGCDEFGYLNMAKAISEGATFGQHASRPYIDDLLTDLRKTFVNPDDYRWMVAPHAYHVSPNLDKIINQYPPGVGILLAPVPMEYRRWAYPALSVLIGCIAILLAGCIDAGRLSFVTLAVLPLITVIVLVLKPMNFELQRVGSLAPTYGLLIGAGWLLPRKPYWSLAFLSGSTLFRIPNALLFVPMAAAALFLSGPRVQSASSRARRALGLGIPILFGGFGIYLVYVFLLLGSPFSPTYSKLDQEFAASSDVIQNLKYYFVNSNEWFICHLVILALLLLISAIRGKYHWFVFAVLLSLFNYAFYILHKVQIDYYPYATSLVSLGLLIGVSEIEHWGRRLRSFVFASGIGLCVLVAATSRVSLGNLAEDHASNVQIYQRVFSGYDVVWSESHSGTVEYTTGRAGFRYNWGPNNVRKYVLLWLRDRGCSQAVWVDDKGMKPQSTIEQFLAESGIPYTKTRSEEMGVVLEISPAIPKIPLAP